MSAIDSHALWKKIDSLNTMLPTIVLVATANFAGMKTCCNEMQYIPLLQITGGLI